MSKIQTLPIELLKQITQEDRDNFKNKLLQFTQINDQFAIVTQAPNLPPGQAALVASGPDPKQIALLIEEHNRQISKPTVSVTVQESKATTQKKHKEHTHKKEQPADKGTIVDKKG